MIGRVERGVLERGRTAVVRVGEAGEAGSFRVTKLFGTKGVQRAELERGQAGEIVDARRASIRSRSATPSATPSHPDPLPRIEVDPPTIRVHFSVNTSPFAGRERRFVTSRQIGERLQREALGNVSVEIEEADATDTFEVAARGELQISVLIETMRREGYEFGVSRPEIIFRKIDGQRCEPVEDVVIEVPEGAAGSVMEKLATRKGRMVSMEQHGDRMGLRYVVPSRGLFGYRSEFLSDTRGEGTLYRTVDKYEPYSGDLAHRAVGAIVASHDGQTTPHAIFKIQERSSLFVSPGEPVYEGQVVGENRRPGDMNVNVCRQKQLTNVRAAGKDDNPIITPARRLTIESALEWIEDDELLEATPENLRLRKKVLSASFRKR